LGTSDKSCNFTVLIAMAAEWAGLLRLLERGLLVMIIILHLQLRLLLLHPVQVRLHSLALLSLLLLLKLLPLGLHGGGRELTPGVGHGG
jgi:hypothetical protein